MIDEIEKIKKKFDEEFLASKIFDDIRELTKENQGVTRDSYGEGENRAIEYLKKLAIQLGLLVEFDAAANMFFSIGDEQDNSYILIGSHIDSVPIGGNFDGLAGVIAGLIILAEIKKNQPK